MLHAASSVEIRRKEISCLAPLWWLNDEVMNIYIAVLIERDALLRQASAVRGARVGVPFEWPAGQGVSVACLLIGSNHTPSSAGDSYRICSRGTRCPHPAWDSARHWRLQDAPKCHFFSTFFANKLYKDTGYSYKEVSVPPLAA